MSTKPAHTAVRNDIHDTEYRWFAIYTKYKAEKYVIAQLNKADIQAYTPLLKVTKKYTRKVKQYEVPLINCYVFVKITKAEYLKILQTQYVQGFVKINREVISIPEREIQIMQLVVGEFEDVALTNENIKTGQEVEIISGRLTGVTGTVIKRNGKHDFLISLERSGFHLQINIDPKLLRPLRQVA